MTQPQPQVSLNADLRKQLVALRKYAQSHADAVKGDKPSQWYTPDGWEQGVLEVEQLGKSFDRKKHGEDFVRVVNSRGTEDDLVLTQLQGDLLACMERAFRLRHTSSVRARAHAAARLAAHGRQNGVIDQAFWDYLTAIDKTNRQAR